MANTVTLTFAGETKPAEDAFGRVGGAAKGMSDKVGGSTRELDKHAGGLNRVGEAADNSERNLIGIHDVIDGTATIMKGPGKQGMVAYIQGWADLAGGLAPLLLSLAQTRVATLAQAAAQKVAAGAARVWTAAQWLMNASLWASPVTWIVAGIVALIAVIVLIATKTKWFQQAWSASWKWIKSAAENTWNWLKKLPGWIGSAFAKVAGFISAPYRAAFNLIADAWNNTIGGLSFTVPGWVPVIGGKSFSVPHLPHFHSGVGVVPGVAGTPTVALLQAGERVSSTASGSSGGEQWIRVDLGDLGEALLRPIAVAVGRKGGQATHLGIRVINGQVRA
jgi:hypothetical protein